VWRFVRCWQVFIFFLTSCRSSIRIGSCSRTYSFGWRTFSRTLVAWIWFDPEHSSIVWVVTRVITWIPWSIWSSTSKVHLPISSCPISPVSSLNLLNPLDSLFKFILQFNHFCLHLFLLHRCFRLFFLSFLKFIHLFADYCHSFLTFFIQLLINGINLTSDSISIRLVVVWLVFLAPTASWTPLFVHFSLNLD